MATNLVAALVAVLSGLKLQGLTREQAKQAVEEVFPLVVLLEPEGIDAETASAIAQAMGGEMANPTPVRRERPKLVKDLLQDDDLVALEDEGDEVEYELRLDEQPRLQDEVGIHLGPDEGLNSSEILELPPDQPEHKPDTDVQLVSASDDSIDLLADDDDGGATLTDELPILGGEIVLEEVTCPNCSNINPGTAPECAKCGRKFEADLSDEIFLD